MTEIYLFSIFWLVMSGYNLFLALQPERDTGDEDDDEDFFDELMEMEKFIPTHSIAKMIPALSIGTLFIDIVGFYLTYCHAYVNVNEIFYRVMFFFACACIFVTEQTIAMRYTLRVSSAIKKLENKPEVLRRWIDINEPNKKTLTALAAIAKFTISLQLALFTVVTSLLA